MTKQEALARIESLDLEENRDEVVVAVFPDLHCEICKRRVSSVFENLLGQGVKIDACCHCQIKLNKILECLESD